MNILIVKLSAIGDVIHTLPSLAALRAHYPHAHITWVIEEEAADLIAGHPHLDSVIISRRKSWIRDLKSGRAGRAVGGMRTFHSELGVRRYDLVIDFHGLLKSALIVMMSRGRRKLGYASLQEGSGLFYSEKIPENMDKHAVDRYLDFVRYLGVQTPTPEFTIPVSAENDKRARELLGANGIGPGDPFIAISPQALWETKLWSNQKFAQLSERIIQELNLPVVLTGGNEVSTEGIRSFLTIPAVDLAGRTTLRDLACILRQASLLITTDSGPMHLAAAVKTPVVALFGPTNPARTGPFGHGHSIVRRDLACSPCLLKICESMRCMREISVDDVFQAVRKKREESAVRAKE
jgi:3-deoxy-D-manno-octulosonic-acid transferase/heptosyltransferase-1